MQQAHQKSRYKKNLEIKIDYQKMRYKENPQMQKVFKGSARKKTLKLK